MTPKQAQVEFKAKQAEGHARQAAFDRAARAFSMTPTPASWRDLKEAMRRWQAFYYNEADKPISFQELES